MFVAGYQDAPTAQMRGMGTLGEGPNRPEIGRPAIDTTVYCRNIEVTEKIARPKPAWIPADWGDHYDTLYNTCYYGHENKSVQEYGDVIGYRIDPGNSTYQYYDTKGKFLYAVPRQHGVPAPLIAAAIAIIAPELAAAINESLTTAKTFESAATTEAVSNGIAKTTLQVASGTPIKNAVTNNVTGTLIETQSAEATNAVDSVLNNPDVSAAIVTTAGIIAKNQAAGKSNAVITRAATASITSPAAVNAVTTAAATLPATGVTTMIDTQAAQEQAALEFAKAEIAAGRTVQQITDDVNAYFNKKFTTQNISDYLAANNLTIQAAQTATGLSTNTMLMLGGGLLLLLLLRK